MILPNRNPPVDRKARQLDRTPAQLKRYLVLLGLRALVHGDMARVDLITQLIRREALAHE
jgi:hypothetical protein